MFKTGPAEYFDPHESNSHRWQCLARYVLDLPNLIERRDFLRRFERNNGTRSTEKLKLYIQVEHEERRRGR